MTTDSQSSTTTTDNMAPSQEWKPSKKLTHRKRRRLTRTFVIALIVALYAAGAYYFSSHFIPGTTVDGVEAGLMTGPELADAISTRTATYELDIGNKDGFEAAVTGEDISLTCDADLVAKEALDHSSPILWFGYLLAPQHMLIDAKVSYDEEALAKSIDTAVSAYNEKAEQPTNATGAYNEKEGVFEPVKESVGTVLDNQKVLDASVKAVRALEPNVVLDANALKQPTITDKDETLSASIKRANEVLDAGEIEVICNGETVATIDKKTMAGWMSFTDEQELKIAGIYDWIKANDAIVAAGNATDDEHVYELDVQQTTDDIHRVMEKDLGDKAEVKRAVIESKPAADPGAKQRGRHIDVNLTTQYVRFYDSDGTVIWESYCVSGGWDPEFQAMHSTPTGTYAIQAKMTNQTLVGADTDKDGEPDYESFVNYWMPFLNYDYGLHDATWRGSFGEGIREWWGSHGCINLPYDKAAELFNIVKVGDTVYIHE